MRAKKTSYSVETQQASVEASADLLLAAERELASFYERIADLLQTAERELASFYEAIENKYGLEEARKAAYDWIEEVETMDWPAEGSVPNWRHVSIAAADCLASRVVEHPPACDDQKPRN
jgi:hypothetical protein